MSTLSNLWKKLFTNLQICKEGKWKFAVTSFLSNAVLVVEWTEKYEACDGVVERYKCERAWLAGEKLNYSGGWRHLRGMNFVQMRRGDLCICAAWLTSHRIMYLQQESFVTLTGIIVHSDMLSFGSLMQHVHWDRAVLMCKRWADRLYHDWYWVNISLHCWLYSIHHSWTRGSSELHTGSMNPDSYQVCFYLIGLVPKTMDLEAESCLFF